MASHAMYLNRGFDKKWVKRIVKEFGVFLKTRPNIKAIICTGNSGMLIAPILRYKYNLELAVVRKNEYAHSTRPIEFSCETDETVGDFVFFDDCIDSGKTYDKVLEAFDGDEISHNNSITNIFLYKDISNLTYYEGKEVWSISR